MTADMKLSYHKNIYLDFIKAQRNISKSTYLTPVDATSDLLQITIIISLILISIYVFCQFYFEMYICSIKKKALR
jgi:hypothetical protein